MAYCEALLQDCRHTLKAFWVKQTSMADLQSLLSTCTLFQSHMHVPGKLRGVSHCVREDRKRVAKMWPKSLLFLLLAVSQKKVCLCFKLYM